MLNKIKYSIEKFSLNLKDKIVLTEATTGDYRCTAIIAEQAGARKVYALAKNTNYGDIDDIKSNYIEYFETNKESNIKIIESLDEIDDKIDIVTNSGFIRPINQRVLKYIDKSSVITLMYEPWEFRSSDMDMELMYKQGIKVYGTNEHDSRLMTMDYIGITTLYLLLDWKITHFSNQKILILGSEEFTEPIERVLTTNGYLTKSIDNYSNNFVDDDYDIFIVAEHKNQKFIIGDKSAYIEKSKLDKNKRVIHICGNVDFDKVNFVHIPDNPAPFGFMSYRTDYVDSMALIDLQTASFKVAEGMLEANRLNLTKKEYKEFIENKYCGLSFEEERYW